MTNYLALKMGSKSIFQ